MSALLLWQWNRIFVFGTVNKPMKYDYLLIPINIITKQFLATRLLFHHTDSKHSWLITFTMGISQINDW